MRKNKISVILKAFLFSLLTITAGCDDNVPEIGDMNRVEVSGISLSELLYSGVILEVGTTLDIALNVAVLPKNATERAESYYSSDVDVAIVNAKGMLYANAPGTSVITVAVGGKMVEFPLVVLEKIIVPATSVQFRTPTASLSAGKKFNAAELVTVLPVEANDGLNFVSSAPGIVSVDADGILTGVSAGSATVTASSKNNPSIRSQLAVTVELFSGDYDRTGWTITASHALFKTSTDAEKNSFEGALDEDYDTNFCMVRPGKKYGSAPLVEVPVGEALFFVVDMQEKQEVNYFKIRHRKTSETFARWHAFDEILGSDDGVNFTKIADNVAITGVGEAAGQVSPSIAIPPSSYRYYKFYALSANCFFQSSYTSQGSSVQIQEFYLGLSR